jgi:hypothetical protein
MMVIGTCVIQHIVTSCVLNAQLTDKNISTSENSNHSSKLQYQSDEIILYTLLNKNTVFMYSIFTNILF